MTVWKIFIWPFFKKKKKKSWKKFVFFLNLFNLLCFQLSFIMVNISNIENHKIVPFSIKSQPIQRKSWIAIDSTYEYFSFFLIEIWRDEIIKTMFKCIPFAEVRHNCDGKNILNFIHREYYLRFWKTAIALHWFPSFLLVDRQLFN